MKTGFITILFLFFCGIACSQNTADYVIGYYVKSYIEKKTDEEWRREATPFQDVWNKLESNSFENPISAVELEKIFPVLPDDLNNENVHQKALAFYNAIKYKRVAYVESSSKQEKIGLLISLPDKYFEDWRNPDTQEPRFQLQYDELTSELDRKIPNDILKDDIIEQNTARESVGRTSLLNPQFIGLALVFILIILVFIFRKALYHKILFWITPKRNGTRLAVNDIRSHQQVEKLNMNEKDYETLFIWILKDKHNLAQFNKVLIQNESLTLQWVKSALKHRQINELLESEFLKAKDKKQNNELKNVLPDYKVNISQIDSFTLFADCIIDDNFNNVTHEPDADTTFVLYLQGQRASFEVFNAAFQRVVANPSFLEGCIKQVMNNASKVKTEERGEARRQADGKWKITRKLNVLIS